jgi:hypothetical protein
VIAGPFHSAHGFFAQHPPQDRECKWRAEVLYDAGDYAAKAGVTLALEAILFITTSLY